MYRGFRTILVAFIAVLMCTSNVFADATFKNGDFEDNFKNEASFWSFTSYNDIGNYSIDTSEHCSGKASVLISNPKKTDSRIAQKVQFEPNSYYKITVMAKCEGVGSEGIGANISAINETFSSEYIDGTTDWTDLELLLKTGKESKELSISLGLGGYSQDEIGKVWFDDVAIKKVNKPKNAEDYTFIGEIASDDDTPKDTNNTPLGIGLLIVLIFLIAIAIWYIYFKKTVKEESEASDYKNLSKRRKEVLSDILKNTEKEKYSRVKLELKDYLIMGITFIVYVCFTLTNLGDTAVPQVGYTSIEEGEICEVSLSKPIQTNKIGLYLGYGVGKYRFQVKNEAGKYENVASYDKVEGQIFKWVFVDMPLKSVTDFRVLTDSVGGTINEIEFLDASKKPYTLEPKSVKALDISGQPLNNQETAKNLFDEQNLNSSYYSYKNSTYFDEIYHARTAYENMNNLPVYEWTHPPLGKLIISIGIEIFGMTPFGWRCMGALFGAMMLPLMYLFGLKIFRKRFYAIISMALLASDFLHFTQSRIATIDVYVTFFTILMYYFMYDYFAHKSYNIGYKKSLVMLLTCGIAFGLGAASKWVGVYAGGGLAVLFFLSKIMEYRDYKKLLVKTEGRQIGWTKNFIKENLVKTCGWCVVFFVVIPLTIYSLSYFPSYLDVPGKDASEILKNQEKMYTYHSKTVIKSTHPYSSLWYQWPTDTKPILFFKEETIPEKQGYSSSIVAMGNPILYWSSLLFLPLAIFFAIKRKDRGIIVLFVAMAFQFVPWMFVERLTFFYHFFSTVPFMVLTVVYTLKCLFDEKPGGKVIIALYAGICLSLFAMFYPVTSGLEVPRAYVDNALMWFKNKDIFKWFF